MREVHYHPKVGEEARALVEHYEAISFQLGDDFWKELLGAIEHAREFPERHHFDRTGRRRGESQKVPGSFSFSNHSRSNPDYGNPS